MKLQNTAESWTLAHKSAELHIVTRWAGTLFILCKSTVKLEGSSREILCLQAQRGFAVADLWCLCVSEQAWIFCLTYQLWQCVSAAWKMSAENMSCCPGSSIHSRNALWCSAGRTDPRYVWKWHLRVSLNVCSMVLCFQTLISILYILFVVSKVYSVSDCPF